MGGVAVHHAVEGRAGREVAREVAGHGSGGGEAVAEGAVSPGGGRGDQPGVASLLAEAEFAAVLHESGVEVLATAPLPASGDIVLVVGPEGGVSPEELALFSEAGARAFRLGRSVLRTSTAGTAAAALLLGRSGRWS
ncbi:hypothetical protein SHKM778_77670 [Streptomyces sp. KM77-8]|uniref:Ribosomal RNA small subunit methyltransferase E n=1 Tax=Streptomyces haneummycinicus TaxID=3074435 RepID=A0AAT9HVA7_9ACTN